MDVAGSNPVSCSNLPFVQEGAPRGPLLAPRLPVSNVRRMRFDGHDPIDPEREEDALALAPLPLDAAESTWDPLLWALYLRAIAAEGSPTLH